LVSFRGVGRVRARTLYDNGIRSSGDIIAADIERLSRMPKIGPALAKSLKAQAGAASGKTEKREKNERREIPPMSEEDEYILERMAEEYSEGKTDHDAQKQSRLFDY
ncbi:MAG: helix-hairpin-helix domain-containing protein, partial [Methanomassiliicoccaceae archaeon]|nr:helix-hairpin-helix domain-containing protein [Methanomassiliicoccaceae archaeon]